MFAKETGEFLVLGREQNPYFPSDFPKELYPDNNCKAKFLELVHCSKIHDNINGCIEFLNEFKSCKSERDFIILESIKRWTESNY